MARLIFEYEEKYLQIYFVITRHQFNNIFTETNAKSKKL